MQILEKGAIFKYNIYVVFKLMATKIFQAFSSGEVTRLTGVTPRQLDTWCWDKFIIPSGESKVHRRYTLEDILKIRAVVTLKEQGISLRFIKRVISRLKQLTSDPLRDMKLVGIGGDIFIYTNSAEVERATDGQMMFIVLDMAKVAKELENNLLELKTYYYQGEQTRTKKNKKVA